MEPRCTCGRCRKSATHPRPHLGGLRAGALRLSDGKLDQERPARLVGLSEQVLEVRQSRRACGFDPHPFRDLDPADVGVAQAHHVESDPAGIGADVRELVEQYGVAPVGQEHGGDRQLLARLGPERLHGVERGAVGLQRDDASTGRGERGARRHGQAAANRCAGDLQPIVGCGRGKIVEEAAAEADAFVDHDSAFGQQRRERLSDRLRVDVAVRRWRDRLRFRVVDRRGGERVSQASQRVADILLGARQNVQAGVFGKEVTRPARIGEGRHRRRRSDEHDVPRVRQNGHGLVDAVREARDRVAASPAFDARVERSSDQLRAGRGGDAVGVRDHRQTNGRAPENQCDRLAPAQDRRDLIDHVRRYLVRRQGGKWCALRPAVVPAGVGGGNQRRDLAGSGACRLNGRRRVLSDGRDRSDNARPRRQAARPALGIRCQRRIEWAMIARLVPDDVDDRRAGAARVVEIGQAVRKAGAAVKQRDRGLLRNAAVAVGGTRRDALEQAQHATHARNTIERRDEMHLAGARIGEAGRHAGCEKRPNQSFSTIHELIPPR